MVSHTALPAFVLTVAVAVFALHNSEFLRRQTPAWPLFIWAFYMLLAARTASVLQGVWWHAFWNSVSYTCQGLSSVLLAVWCWHSLLRGRFGELHGHD